MGTVLPKHQMSEEDIKLQYITPAILSKWNREKITMETRITDGRINFKGNFVFREKPKRADYILYLNDNNLIAVMDITKKWTGRRQDWSLIHAQMAIYFAERMPE